MRYKSQWQGFQSAFFAAVAAVSAFLPLHPADAVEPRNIVFILVDDQRYDALGFMGHPFLKTPNLDRMAANGLVFDNAFVTTALCSPSRASILAGLYAHEHGVLDNSTRLDPTVPTFPQELQRAGYETAFVGKWHMGGDSDEPRPGFDHWASFRGQGVYLNPPFNVDGRREEHRGEHVSDVITDYAEAFLCKDRDKPFLLYISHKAVHAPFEPDPRHKGVYAGRDFPHPASMADTGENYTGKPAWVRNQRISWHGVDGMYNNTADFDQFARDYAETMLSVDDSVGRIIRVLDENGLLDSTLVIYTSDNGFLFGEHGLIDKRCMYEESIRVPLIVHCPELIPEGLHRSEMILNIDFAPTFLAAAGAAIPASMQGMSFLPLIDGREVQWRDAFLYEYYWERSFPQTPTVLGIRTDRYKLMRFHGVWDLCEFYDLQADPREMNNLVGGISLTTQAGAVEGQVQVRAQRDVNKIFTSLDARLNELLDQTRSRREPNWRIP